MPMATRNSEAVKYKHVLYVVFVFLMFATAGTVEFSGNNKADKMPCPNNAGITISNLTPTKIIESK